MEQKGIELEGSIGATTKLDLKGSSSIMVLAGNLPRTTVGNLSKVPFVVDNSLSFAFIEFSFSHNWFNVLFIPS